MKRPLLFFFISLLFLQCIGEDFIDDYVDPTLRITNPITSIQEGLSYQFQAQFFDESGTKVESPNLNWSAHPSTALGISSDGTITALAAREVSVTVSALGLQGESISTTIVFSVTPLPMDELETPDNGIMVSDQFFEGQLRSTSSYLLEGNFRYEFYEQNIVLSLDESYRADTALPGLYIYLTNNPSTPMGGYEIGQVFVFEGAHQYELPSSIALMDYKYILYWCKPFSVKVGDALLFDD